MRYHRVRILLAFGMLVFFALVIWKPSITGQAAGGEPQKVVVVLRPGPSSGITGAVTVNGKPESVEELKEFTKKAQKEVLEDVNKPSLTERILSIESTAVVSERELEIIPAMVVDASPEGIEELKSHPLVEAVYPNIMFELVLNQSVPLINADDVWTAQVNNENIDGNNMSVCVIDTGIDTNHPMFENRVVDQKCYCSSNCCPNGQATDTVATDTHSVSHGTHVSGIVGGNAKFRGTAPGANIVAVKVCDAGCGLSDIFSGLDYCLQVKDQYNVVAISGSIGDGGNYQVQSQCPTFFDAAIDAAYNAGIVSVFASGNNGYTNGISYPGCSPNAIAAGATDKSDNIAGFSNRGPLLEVLAPGVGIWSAKVNNQYRQLSGTSQATPHVSGAVALIMQYAQLTGLSLTPDDVKNTLMSTGVMIDGYPRIDVLAALESLGLNVPNSPPVPVISSPEEDAVVKNPVLLSGNATDSEDGIVSNLTWSENAATVGSGNVISANFTLGVHTVQLTAIDSEGAQASANITFTVVDNIPPFPVIYSPEENETVTNPVALSGNATDSDGTIANLTWMEDDTILGTGSEISVNLSVGAHTITLTAKDNENTTSSTDVMFRVLAPNTAPVPIISSPQENETVNSPVTLKGNATDAEDGNISDLQWYENSTIIGNGSEIVHAFSPGQHTVTLTAQDSQNATNQTFVTFTSQTCHLDLDQNANNMTDVGDFVMLLTGFAEESLPCVLVESEHFCTIELDMNSNGIVDSGDFVLLLGAYAEERILDINGQLC